MLAAYDFSQRQSTISPVAAPLFTHRLDFTPENSDALLRSVPAAPGVFSLRGETGEPYLTRTADLRRRLRRLLAPPEALDENGNAILAKRLNLRDRVRFIDYTRTGSDFESTLLLYHATRAAFGADEARKRLRLHTPYFLRVTISHEHPRVYATNRLGKKSLAESFGPFPSRAAAERYCDAVLDLFKLRRCYEDLQPYPDHPGCVYGEMNKCLMPCKEGNPTACTPADYAAESARVFAFFATRGQSLLDEVAAQREAASADLDFELAATLHKHWEKVRAAAQLSDELVRPITQLRALVIQSGAPGPDSETRDSTELSHSNDSAAVFLLNNGHLTNPAPLSTLGVRAVREQTAVGSSLFAQPLMLAPVPLDTPTTPTDFSSRPEAKTSTPPPDFSSRPEAERSGDAAERPASELATDTSAAPYPLSSNPYPLLSSPEDRARALIAHLEFHTTTPAPLDELCDALSLFRRWYYRPEKQRAGEVFLPNADATWPVRRILNAAARVVLGPPTEAAPVDREAAKILKTKIIHAGREGVEKTVPVLPRRKKTTQPPGDSQLENS
jgi:hypothetical protein